MFSPDGSKRTFIKVMGKVIGEVSVFFNLLPLLHSVFTIQGFRDYEFRN